MRSRLFMGLLLMLTALSGGCAKKHADLTPTPTPEPPPAPAAESPAPPVAPPAAAAPAPAPDPLAGDLAAVNRYVREQGLLADVLFEYDRDDLTEAARRQLETNARFLKDRPQFRVALEGHADERGTVEYNVALGQKRAVSARSHLDALGIPLERLQPTSYGEERPLCTDPSENCWQRNRRVHFEIVERIE
jgi:peptidoglycan-associated lipoprotein